MVGSQSEKKPRVNLSDAIRLLQDLKRTHPKADKAEIERAFAQEVEVKKERSVFVADDYVIRFSEVKVSSFSNVVLSLSTLRKYDTLPFVVCVVRPDRLDFRLANTTFLKRISHSSHALRTDNIRGSFLGNDIIDKYESTPNRMEHFEVLFAIHSEFKWAENVERLVEATNSIVARAIRFDPTESELSAIFGAPERAKIAMSARSVQAAESELTSIVGQHQAELLLAASINNVNIRGNTLERIITGAVNAHRLEDLTFNLSDGGSLMVDVKTKLLDRASAPKGYNIDKMLRILAQPGSLFAFFFIGLDASRQAVYAKLVSIFDPVIIDATRIQTHWAGRASRGVTQLTGDLGRIFAPGYRPSISVDNGIRLLRHLIGIAR